jgi:tetratricopeptide (TPR) repeat protein
MQPWMLVGWLWYLIALFPMIGIIRRGLWPAMADRFVYLPMIGILLAVVWSAGELAEKYGLARMLQFLASTILLMLLAIVCHRQVSFWHDSGTLFQRAVEVTELNDIALANLGWHRFSEGRHLEALLLFQEAAVLDPGKPDFEYANGSLEFNAHRYAAAAEWFERAHARNGKHLASLYFLGLARERSSDYEGAAQAYLTVMDTDGLDPAGYRGKGSYRLMQIIHPALHDKMTDFAADVRSRYSGDETHRMIAGRLYEYGMLQEALREYRAIRSTAVDFSLLNRMADIYRRIGEFDKAEQLYRTVLGKDAVQSEAIMGLSRILVQRDGWETARQLIEESNGHGAESPDISLQLALCYYSTGRWQQALTQFRLISLKYPELKLISSRYITILDKYVNNCLFYRNVINNK